jgi:glycosyltransferase involved in cell wall biosynthesis
VWSLISSYGLRAGIQDAISRWLQSRLSVPRNVLRDYGWVLHQDRPAILETPNSGPIRINWILPDVGQGIGGLLNIFRTIHQLEHWGHKQRVYVAGRSAASGEQIKELVHKYYSPILSDFEIYAGKVVDSDALVATSWRTAYVARTLANTARKFYFVQDLEHLFYPQGSLCEFAKQTYRWGFHGITLGQWIANVLSREFGMECSAFGFSYDRGIYSPNGTRRFQDERKRVLFYARPSTERRGFELGILALSLVAKRMPDVEFVLVGFSPRSIRLPFSAISPGIVAPSDLAALYRSSTVALVLSLTNPSMLPLELMACGCAVVSNSGPNVEWLLTQQTTQLASPTPEALADAMLTLLENQQLRARKVAAGLSFAESTDWSAEIKAIESIFYRCLNIPAARVDKV